MKKMNGFLKHISQNRRLYTWIIIFVLFIIGTSQRATLPGSVIMTSITIMPMIILTECLNRFLIPRFLKKTRVFYYLHSFMTIVILALIFAVIDIRVNRFLYFNNQMIVSEEVLDNITIGQTRIGWIYLSAKFLILLCITFTVVTIQHMLDERKTLEQETKEQQMLQELKYLRAQINPHFLFNALNCIYSLSLTKDEKASDSILKLSDMMRFVIDDCRADLVPIVKEVAYIRNYIDFQKIRMENEPNLDFFCKIENDSYEIPPMIFQPMVENCFKHSRIIDNHNAYIKISLVQENDTVTFVTENSKHKSSFSQNDNERTGIGVYNVQQRLDILFGDNYSFDISEDDNVFKAKLIIKA